MNDTLKRDICDIGDLNKQMLEIDEIEELMSSCIYEQLTYACRFWIEHILDIAAPVSFLFIGALRTLLFNKLLPWIEVMALRNTLQHVTEALLTLKEWLQVSLNCYKSTLISL